MQYLFEDPLPILAIGGLTVAILIGGWLKTGRAFLLWGGLATVVVTGTMFVLESVVVTPVEEVENTLKDIAIRIAANDVEAVTGGLASAAEDLRREARQIMKQITVHQVKIKNNLEVDIPEATPNTATAQFNAVLVASDRSGTFSNRRSAWFFIVNFVKEGDAWRVTSYERRDPLEGLGKEPQR